MTAADRCAWGSKRGLAEQCPEPSLPGLNPFCQRHDLEMLVWARETFPDAADADFEREVPRG